MTMTIAEALEARGKRKAMIQVAKNLLNKGLDRTLIAETTNLEIAKIEELSQQLEHKN